MKRFFLFLTLLVLSFSSAQDIQDDLPVLGDRSSASVSLSGEFEMGRLWLSLFRSQAKEHSDPLVRSYIEDLIYRLAENSQVKDRRFEFIIIDDKSINAFAAAGGIIGINTGLFFYTNDESEFSSVMTHELAHLSQRHYARSQNRGSPLANALMILGSIALAAASNNPQAIITGPALMQQLNTNFTRSNEQEADRIGFNNLVRSGFDPKGQGRMFKILQDLSRNNSEDQFNPLQVAALTWLAIIYLENADYDQVISLFESSNELTSTMYELKGDAENKLGQSAEARMSYMLALQTNTNQASKALINMKISDLEGETFE